MTGINDTGKFRRDLSLARCSRFLQDIQLHGMPVLPGDRVHYCRSIPGIYDTDSHPATRGTITCNTSTAFTITKSTRLTRTVKLEIE